MVRRSGSSMVSSDRAMPSFYGLPVVTMSLSATIWPQFATQVFECGAGNLRYIGSYVKK